MPVFKDGVCDVVASRVTSLSPPATRLPSRPWAISSIAWSMQSKSIYVTGFEKRDLIAQIMILRYRRF